MKFLCENGLFVVMQKNILFKLQIFSINFTINYNAINTRKIKENII